MQGILARVLIVEDEYYLGKMLEKALLSENIEAFAVTNVDAAIDHLERMSFDLIVSDIYMPGKNGLDLFEYSKKAKNETPFIFMTGNPDLKIAVNFLTSGGYDYIVKPFMISDFIQKIKPIIKNHRVKTEEKNLVNDLQALLSKRVSELKIYQDIFDSTDYGEVVVDVDGYIVKANRRFEKMIDVSGNDLLQKHINFINEEYLHDFNFKSVIKFMENGNTWNEELKGFKPDKGKWIVNISFSPIRNETSQVFAYTGIFKNVTEQREVEQELITSLKKMNLAQEAIIFGMARLAEHRDSETGFHLERIRNYCKKLAEALYERKMYANKIDEEFIQTLYHTAPLHDIGKVGIPDYILLKSDTLTPEEFEVMKSHTLIGHKTLNSIFKQYGEMQFLEIGLEVTSCHHERWDGKGYPRGLKGSEIPLSAQILSIVDVYDALTSERTYKKAYRHTSALESMKKERGNHFSPEIFDVFLEISEEIDSIRKSFSEQCPEEIPDEIPPEIAKILYKS